MQTVPSLKAKAVQIDGNWYAKDRILVKFKDPATIKLFKGARKTKLSQLSQRLGLPEGVTIENGGYSKLEARAAGKAEDLAVLDFKSYQVAQLHGSIGLDECLRLLQNHPFLEYAELDGLVFADRTVPSDPQYSQQWHHDQIEMPLAWDFTQGSASVTVAVLDTGVKLNREEFSGRLVPGFDFANFDSNANDDNGHGTAVAGILAANANNAAFFAGVDWKCRIMPVKVLDNEGTGIDSAIADGIDFAVANGAKVMNLSLGRGGPSNQTVVNAIRAAVSQGVVFVASSGNDGERGVIFPANVTEAIAVGATNRDDTITSFSNWGSELDLVAPGQEIYTFNIFARPGTTAFLQGTSFSAPLVAGVASLIAATNPDLSSAAIRSILCDSADDQVGDQRDTPGFDEYHGCGRLNAKRALQIALDVPDIDLAITNLAFSPSNIQSGQQPTSVSYRITNFGPDTFVSSGSPFTVELFLSNDSTFGDSDDILFGQTDWMEGTLLAGNPWNLQLNANALSEITLPAVSAGNYHVFASIRLDDPILGVEENAGNNYTGVEITVSLDTVDLAISNFQFSPSVLTFTERPVAVSYRITNHGPGRFNSSGSPLTVTLHLSDDQNFGDTDDVGMGETVWSIGNLSAGNSWDLQLNANALSEIAVPRVSTGTYTIFASLDISDTAPVAELNENNNHTSAGTTLTVSGAPRVDLTITDFAFFPSDLFHCDLPTGVSYRITNNGPNAFDNTGSSYAVEMYLSENQIFGDGDDRLLGETAWPDGILPAGDSWDLELNGDALSVLTIQQIPQRSYTVFARIRLDDPSSAIDVDDANNHTAAESAITVLGPRADHLITVNSTGDTDSRDSVITLREAIMLSNGSLSFSNLTDSERGQVNGTVGSGIADTVCFCFSGTISVTSLFGLPLIVDNGTIIDASPRWNGAWPKGRPGITLDRVGRRFDKNGLTIRGGASCEILGLFITNFGGAGIAINRSAKFNTVGGSARGSRNVISGNDSNGVEIINTGTDNNVVSGNYIGTDVSGAADLGNTVFGVFIGHSAQSNTVGGTTAGERNIISGNGNAGVRIETSATNNVVSGNYVGTDVTGTSALGNAGGGFIIGDDVQFLTIGGTTAGERNIISGNAGGGVNFFGARTKNNTVSGNYIGTDVTGTAALENSGWGIRIADGAQSNTIGGTTAGERNIISGNDRAGVLIVGTGTDNNVVSGNYIGTDVDGTGDLGNSQWGVLIAEGAKSNTIGGTTAGERNIISGNFGDGVLIGEAGTDNNVVSGNYIGTDVTGTADLGNQDTGVGIVKSAKSNTIGGTAAGERNIISGNGRLGVGIEGAGTNNNVVSGNYIGTDVNGTTDLGNFLFGIIISDGAQSNTIGGTTAGERNIISGNGLAGVSIADPGSVNNVVKGNFIGTDVSGTEPLGNTLDGVFIVDGARSNIIGGESEGEGNVISGNEGSGVFIANTGTTGNVVQGNFIGTDVTGTVSLGNRDSGVNIAVGAQFNTVGGTTEGARNIISGNQRSGVVIIRPDTDQNVVIGNYIGPDVTGMAAIGNGDWGVVIRDEASLNRVGSDGDGVTDAAEGNVISGNASDGVRVESGTGNVIRSNSIFSNGGLGIDLGEDGVTPNDLGDRDTGPNNLQNFPVISFSTQGPTRIVGTLNSLPNEEFAVDFYVNRRVDRSRFGEGERYLGSAIVISDSLGDATYDVTFAEETRLGEFITATATDSMGSTSEFSEVVLLSDGGPTASAETFVVTNTRDSGARSLRESIVSANMNPGFDTIVFDIPGQGPHTIQPISGLPEITDAVFIDGFTQSGASPNTNLPGLGSNAVLKIELDGSNAGGTDGLAIIGANCIVKGLVINRFRGSGILIDGTGASGNVVEGNFIGTDSDGTLDLGNFSGVVIEDAPNNTVGGSLAGEGNLISGNNTGGIFVSCAGASGNVVQGNLIGTDVTGRADMGNGGSGVIIQDAPNNTIGGSQQGEGNIISGNGGDGIAVGGAGASGNAVQGNYIGTDATGSNDLGNVRRGVLIIDAPDNTIGGSQAGKGNIISGNDWDGIFISRASGNVVQGNYIGTDVTGSADLGNGSAGVSIDDAPENTVGGAQAGEGNVTAFNDFSGVAVGSSPEDTSVSNSIRGNEIYSNGALGIDIGDDGVSANDDLDADAGPNNFQNFPVITSALATESSTRIVGSLGSLPNEEYTLDFYASSEADVSNHGEGERYLGSAIVMSDGFGEASFDVTFAEKTRSGEFITATATDSTGSTSEFSEVIILSEGGPSFSEGEPPAPSPFESAVELSEGWWFSDWLGSFNTNFLPWIFHAEHSWMYLFEESTSDDIFLYDLSLEGWIFTNSAIYPGMYSFGRNGWIFYFVATSGPRQFVDLESGEFFSLE